MPSCCGKPAPLRPTPAPQGSPPEPPPAAPPPVHFTYTGERALSARGPITGRIYRFARAGEVVPVDPRDALGMAAVPSLRRVAR